MMSSTTYITSISMKPVKPPGASSLALWRLYHLAGRRMQSSSTMTLMNIVATVLVIEMSKGRFSSPFTSSTIFPSLSPFVAMTKLSGPCR